VTEPRAIPHAKLTPMPSTTRKRLIMIGAVVGVVLLVVVVAPFVYIHFFSGNTPKKLSLSSGDGGTTTIAPSVIAPMAGTWTVGAGSTAGYRVDEVLFGQSTTAVGRTKEVTGSMTIAGTTVTAATFTVEMTTLTSDRSQRDQQFQGIMDTAQFPQATFVTTAPIALGTAPADGKTITVNATGKLTLHGQTKTITTPLRAKRTGNTIQVLAAIPVKFSDYGIASPNAGFVTTQDHGTVEVLLVLSPGSA
jgi:polyisoprenoid-binding protein YceI